MQQEDSYTVAYGPKNVLAILILQCRNDAREAIEHYQKFKFAGAKQGNVHILRARIASLFYELEAAMRRHYEKNKARMDKLETQAFSEKPEDVIRAFRDMNAFLDTIQLTRFDTRKKYDTTRAEEENREKSL